MAVQPRIEYFQLGLAILVHEWDAFFIHKRLHLTGASHQHPQPTLNASHHCWKKGKRLVVHQQNRQVHHIGNDNFIRECRYHASLQPYHQKSRQQSSVRDWDPGLMMETLKDHVRFEGVFVRFRGVRASRCIDPLDCVCVQVTWPKRQKIDSE